VFLRCPVTLDFRCIHADEVYVIVIGKTKSALVKDGRP
jgi:hypothetical protein